MTSTPASPPSTRRSPPSTRRSPPSTRRSRPLLGVRRAPGRLALAVFRMPLRAYHHGAGWMLGHTFLAFTHIGRTSGAPHEAVAMALRYDPASQEAVICAGWGPATDWYRNLQHGPAREVRIGREAYAPEHRFLDTDEAVSVTLQFRRKHPRRVWLISRILGWGDLSTEARIRELVSSHPFVAFRPAARQARAGDTGVGRV